LEWSDEEEEEDEDMARDNWMDVVSDATIPVGGRFTTKLCNIIAN